MDSRKRKRTTMRSEAEDHCSSTSSSGCNSALIDKPTRSTSSSHYIPREIGDWTSKVIENLHVGLNWMDPYCWRDSIDEFLDTFINISADLPSLNTDLTKIEQYLESVLTFDTSINELELENHVKIRQYLSDNFHLDVNDADDELMKNIESDSRILFNHVEAGRQDFLSDLKEILYDLLLTSRTVEKVRFTTMLEKFCRMCCFKGSLGLISETTINDVRVVGVPDITFRISSHQLPDIVQIMTIAEIMLTCLSASPRYCTHIKGHLNLDDKATLHFIGPYDILKAGDRSQLIKAFIRLGNRQRLGNPSVY
ncbi:uncharacterized protein LOC127707655 isoform X2 [Mytilus californianus]|uniref:uncharacterized protein LOC127707655 isoform X2 n=1 Tax=Mytilus californianus TaxID=6549 RepID=UPI0022458490|nr:uncharacterized protein LOC127707655 isoform X2 [Mytilus californianus]